jgi:hypothetical protein
VCSCVMRDKGLVHHTLTLSKPDCHTASRTPPPPTHTHLCGTSGAHRPSAQGAGGTAAPQWGHAPASGVCMQQSAGMLATRQHNTLTAAPPAARSALTAIQPPPSPRFLTCRLPTAWPSCGSSLPASSTMRMSHRMWGRPWPTCGARRKAAVSHAAEASTAVNCRSNV